MQKINLKKNWNKAKHTQTYIISFKNHPTIQQRKKTKERRNEKVARINKQTKLYTQKNNDLNQLINSARIIDSFGFIHTQIPLNKLNNLFF